MRKVISDWLSVQILKPAEKRAPKYGIGGVTPPRKQKKKDGKTS